MWVTILNLEAKMEVVGLIPDAWEIVNSSHTMEVLGPNAVVLNLPNAETL